MGDRNNDNTHNNNVNHSHSMWGHLPLLLRANSKESVEYILQALWRTRSTGLDAADRQIFRDILQLPNDSDLDPLLVCLRVLIRRFVYENVNKDEIQKLFPAEVLPELQRLLTLLLQKFQKEWREDLSKDQVVLPRLKAMTWNMANHSEGSAEPAAVINLKLQSDAQPSLGERDIKFQLAKDTMEMMLKSMYCIRDQLSDPSGDLRISMLVLRTSTEFRQHGRSEMHSCVKSLGYPFSEKVIPAYSSFMRRFGSHLESGRHAERYIKDTPEDLESYLLDIFEGTPLILHHMRRKGS